MRKPMKHNEPNGSAGELMLELARTPWGESPLNTKNSPLSGDLNGGIEGARTLDLLRDRQTL